MPLFCDIEGVYQGDIWSRKDTSRAFAVMILEIIQRTLIWFWLKHRLPIVWKLQKCDKRWLTHWPNLHRVLKQLRRQLMALPGIPLNVVFILSRLFPNIVMDGRGYLRICIYICYDRGLHNSGWICPLLKQATRSFGKRGGREIESWKPKANCKVSVWYKRRKLSNSYEPGLRSLRLSLRAKEALQHHQGGNLQLRKWKSRETLSGSWKQTKLAKRLMENLNVETISLFNWVTFRRSPRLWLFWKHWKLRRRQKHLVRQTNQLMHLAKQLRKMRCEDA